MNKIKSWKSLFMVLLVGAISVVSIIGFSSWDGKKSRELKLVG
jgi:hypothetical protein